MAARSPGGLRREVVGPRLDTVSHGEPDFTGRSSLWCVKTLCFVLLNSTYKYCCLQESLQGPSEPVRLPSASVQLAGSGGIQNALQASVIAAAQRALRNPNPVTVCKNFALSLFDVLF